MKFVTLGELAEFINGYAFKPSDWGSSGKPIIRIQNLTNSDKPYNRTKAQISEKYLVQPGDILVSWSASLGVFVWDRHEEGLVNQHIFKVVPSKLVEKQYFLHALKEAIIEMDKHLHGATMKHVNRGEFLSTKIPLPSLSEQRRIAAILDKADAIRRKRQRAIELTEDFLRSAFLEMFGDPVTNPEGWCTKLIANIAIRFSDGPFGSNLKTSHYVDEGIRVIRLQNIGIGEFLDEDKAYISEKHFNSLIKYKCVSGDIILGTLGDPNLRACILPREISVAINKADCVQLRPNPNVALSEYLCWLLNTPATLSLASNLIHGQTRSRISMGQLRELSIPVPPIELQRQFTEIVHKAFKIKEKRRKALDLDRNLFNCLTHLAFCGELTPQTADELLQEAAAG